MDENDYDNLRKRNIAERNAVFAEFFKDIKKQTNEVKELEKGYEDIENSENEPPRKRRKTVCGSTNHTIKIKHVQAGFRKKYNTRSTMKNRSKDDFNISRYKEEEEEDSIESRSNRPKLQVLFPWAKPFQRSLDLMQMGVCDVDQEEQQYSDDDLYDITKKHVYQVTKAPYDPNSIPSVNDITDEMLNNVAKKSSLKQYCKINGTCCHQCRQKTLDTKTVCRSGECIGVRGQFCGPCLKGRYGEDAIDALKDPNWACPPCRDLCNCSICRTKSGLRPTGILAPMAQEEGYSSVMDYLQSTEIDDT
ncbi:Cell division cycle-associated 7-like protein [Eufriesea mexicana]|uniref:Cell division cycle-associated 7-like protein n=1 Tax=Eufriesea mexicana TaxID=516756 RepID=A0A310S6S1_9HYME|nr:PREDICTED: cell division cycle-associated protein 7-like [Eufriesea mexicana]OAD52026.1 Cell division cycle-associated 7-like protein [Eufriesea mexicana]